jgi:predicted acyl esterase
VVYVHRLGQSRLEDLPFVSLIADHGYAVWAYDVRGQGSGMTEPANAALPTNGSTLWGTIERYDLAEEIQFVAAHAAWQGWIDTTRTAVIGPSQGGVHAWAAAAQSGRPLTVPGRGTITFPPITCAVAADYVAEPAFDWLRGGKLWSSWFIDQISDDLFPHPGYVLDPVFWQASAAAFRAQDPQSLLTAWAADGRRIDGMLSTLTVPVLVSHAYHDLIDSPLPTLQMLAGVQAPTKILLSTIGHNTTPDTEERTFRDVTILRWLEHWLWQVQNGIDREPPFVLSEMPLDDAQRNDVGWLWNRRSGQNPLHAPSSTRYWLYDDGTLQGVEPAQVLPSATIAQTIVDPTFTPAFYIASANNRVLAGVLAACPLSEIVYATPPLASESQLGACAAVHLQVTPDHQDWMIAALLTVQPPNGNEEMLSCNAFARGDSTIGVGEAVDITLPPVAARLPAGSVVRLRLRNLWLREAPMARVLEVAPLFHDFQLAVGLGSAVGGSWIDLPLAPVRNAIVADTQFLDTAVMAPVHLTIRAGAAHAHSPYFVTASASGQVPGTPYQNDVIPITVDWFTGVLTVSLNTPFFTGFLGDLDGDGNGSAVFDLSQFAPFDPGLAGLRVTFAAYAWDYILSPGGTASNPVDVFVR